MSRPRFWPRVALAGSLLLASGTPLLQADQPTDNYGFSATELINKQIRQSWADNELLPAKPATDGEWCRRVHLDIIGRVPTVAELNTYLQDKSTGRRARLVDRLLDDKYNNEYARNWSSLWTNVLIGRTGGTERRSLTHRPSMQQYLRDSLRENKAWDTIVQELVTATGSTRPAEMVDPGDKMSAYNPATNFLVGKFEEDAAQAAAKTAQIFLGIQVQCTQCHNHPFNDWKQNQFWEFNAFFRQSRPLRSFNGRDIANVRLVDEGFAGSGARRDPADAVVFYELRNGVLAAAYPRFVDGTSLVDLYGEEKGRSGYLEDINRRQELGKLIVKSELLDRAIVNRYWSHFFGYGFTKPIDDMGPHNPPTHPELLAGLADEFREHGRDLKQLVRWITLSEAYSLSSRTTAGNEKDDPQLGEPPMFSHFYLRQMRAEELYESLLVATEAHKTRGNEEEQEAAKRRWLGQFVTAFGTDEGGDQTTFNGTIPQSLMMMAGEMVKRATDGSSGSYLERLASRRDLTNAKKIEHLYLAGLARKPDSREIGMANKFLQARQGSTVGALQDVWWVILNSNEFILNH